MNLFPPQNTTVVITGATGFIGYHLAQRLCQAGYDVHILVRPTSNLDRVKNLPKIQIHVLPDQTNARIEQIKQIQPRCIFHLASLFLAEHTPENIQPLIEANILFGTQLLEAALQQGVPFFINTATAWQHYQQAAYDPTCLYAATKQAFEDILLYYVNSHALHAVSLTLFDTYGPNDPRRKLFSLFKTAETTPIAMSAGEQLLDLVYISDVTVAFLRAWQWLEEERPPTHQKFSVSSGQALPLRQIAELYSTLSGKPLHIEWGKRPYRAREVMHPWQNGLPLPGWQPQIQLEEGIRQILTL
jgi:nucleoside-diphosphate-sugar epimerase